MIQQYLAHYDKNGYKILIFISGRRCLIWKITLADWRKSLSGYVVFDRNIVTVLLKQLEYCKDNHNELIFAEVC